MVKKVSDAHVRAITNIAAGELSKEVQDVWTLDEAAIRRALYRVRTRLRSMNLPIPGASATLARIAEELVEFHN